jgi:hypothetical protein
MNIYNKIWVDCIVRLKSLPKNKDNWELKAMIMMTMAMTFNFALVMAILQRNILGYYFYKLDFSFLPERTGNVISFIILFILPCLIINYLLIFRKRRYRRLIEKYPYYNGKLSLAYILISMFLPIVLLVGGMIYARYF